MIETRHINNLIDRIVTKYKVSDMEAELLFEATIRLRAYDKLLKCPEISNVIDKLKGGKNGVNKKTKR